MKNAMLKLNMFNWKRILILLIFFMGVLIAATTVSADALTLTATAKVNSADGAYMRSTPSISSDKNKIRLLKDNKSIVINKEVFTSTKSIGKKKVWYYITVSGKKGYIRSDCVDSIKYSPVKGTTTDTINYRVGPNTAYTSEGTINNDTTVSRCLKAYLKGNSQVWYKIKKDGKYYYVSGEFVKKYVEPSKKITITTEGLTYPTKVWQGVPFYLRGIITSNTTIEKVRIGVRNAENTLWVVPSKPAQNDSVNANTFDISTLDSQVSFGKLTKGAYIYRVDVFVDGKWKNNIVKKSFTVKVIKTGESAGAIADQAVAIAWPDDANKEANSAFNGGDATDAFKDAFDAVFPDHTSWGNKYTKVGADCGVFVATVIRSCGYDKTLTYNLTNSTSSLFALLPSDTAKWQQLFSYNSADGEAAELSESLYKSGDIIMYHKKSGGQHILIYVKKDGVGYMVEAANTGSDSSSYYGRMDKATSKITNLNKYTDFYVYRAAK